MTTKVLPGSSREALRFIFLHWQSLVKISCVPLGIYLAVSVFQINSLSSFYRSMGTMMDGQATDPNFMSAYMRGMALSFLASFLSLGVLGLLFSQIVRFHKSGQANWFPTDRKSLAAGGLTLVYGLGMGALTVVAYLGSVFAYALLLTLLALLVAGGGGGGETVVMGFLAIAGGAAVLAGLYWFLMRFLAGLPGVALGHSPDFFKDIWPLARGESWALPMRMMLATIAAYVPMLLIVIVFGGSLSADYFAMITQTTDNNNPAAMFPLMADIMDQMLPLVVLMMLVFTPFMWFMTLLLAIAFQRFRSKQG